MFYWFVKGIFHPFARLYLGLTREGIDHLPRRGPGIVVCNHASYMDPIILGSATPRALRFMVLQWMYDLVLLRWFYWGMGTVPVRAEGQDSRAIRTALRILGSGGLLAIFPEGTRSADGRLVEPRPGAALIATMAGVPVFPAWIDGARRSLPVGGRFPKPARIHVRFGPPLTCPPKGARDRETIAAFSATMHEAIRRLEPAA